MQWLPWCFSRQVSPTSLRKETHWAWTRAQHQSQGVRYKDRKPGPWHIKELSTGEFAVNFWHNPLEYLGFPVGSDVKESGCNAGHPGSILGLGRSPGEENGNPLQYSCLENPMDRGAWQATAHGVSKNQTRLKRLSMHARYKPQVIFQQAWFCFLHLSIHLKYKTQILVKL